ncbi:hypothetical protein [Aurantimonas coralicida]|uniref:hypothetical protein n=1 Tax=Aurantimonas coralicida TaxID=182270 RepID=UPI001E363FC1|nr:hypothetical protein [Aurantimonas coralicida]MCD1642472.1 hypothetical protein [Aurantimonas coralicida]
MTRQALGQEIEIEIQRALHCGAVLMLKEAAARIAKRVEDSEPMAIEQHLIKSAARAGVTIRLG